MATRRPVGAPRRDPDELKKDHLTIWLTAAEKALIERAATSDDDRMGNWGRRALLRAAREALGHKEELAHPRKGAAAGRG